MSKSYQASAPGSLMLLGEHAVLHGKLALVCAVDRRIAVRLTPQPGKVIRVYSNLGICETALHRPVFAHAFRFVGAVIHRFRGRFPSGFDLHISSEFSHTVGLGSSAAVTVALCAVLARWLGFKWNREKVFAEALRVIRDVQGLGSGADVAASVFGGVIEYCVKPLFIRKINRTFPLTVIYSGSKKPTADVVRLVEAERQKHLHLFDSIYDAMDSSVTEAVRAIRRSDWKAFGRILNVNHGLMAAIGVSNCVLSEIAYALRGDAHILGSKISGSGLGDCVVGLGRAAKRKWPHPVIPVKISPDGLRVEVQG